MDQTYMKKQPVLGLVVQTVDKVVFDRLTVRPGTTFLLHLFYSAKVQFCI